MVEERRGGREGERGRDWCILTAAAGLTGSDGGTRQRADISAESGAPVGAKDGAAATAGTAVITIAVDAGSAAISTAHPLEERVP